MKFYRTIAKPLKRLLNINQVSSIDDGVTENEKRNMTKSTVFSKVCWTIREAIDYAEHSLRYTETIWNTSTFKVELC